MSRTFEVLDKNGDEPICMIVADSCVDLYGGWRFFNSRGEVICEFLPPHPEKYDVVIS